MGCGKLRHASDDCNDFLIPKCLPSNNMGAAPGCPAEAYQRGHASTWLHLAPNSIGGAVFLEHELNRFDGTARRLESRNLRQFSPRAKRVASLLFALMPK